MTLIWPGHRLVFALAVVVIFVWLGSMGILVHKAALKSDASGILLAVFEPGTSEELIFGNIVAAGGNPVRKTWLPFVWVAASTEPGFVGRLSEHGAIGAYGELPLAPAVVGCLAYADAKVAEIFALRP